MPHECDVCGREFSRKANLTRHRDTIHGDVAEISSGEESMDTEPGSYRSADIFDDTDDLSEEATTEHDTESLESYEECEVSEEDESVADSQEVESATETDSDQSGSESDASSIVSSSPTPSDESEEYGYDSGDEEEWTLYRDWTIPLTHDPGDVPQRVIKETKRAGKKFYNKDVVPMLEAIQKMVDFYRDLGIDMLKDGISVPGLTLKYLFMNLESDTYFTLVDNEEVYKLFKQNIVGGPSIIFHRYHQKGETFIRQKEMTDSGRQPKLCQKVIGFDANALYLWSLMENMPTGYYIRRQAETGFVKEYSAPSRGRMATEWLDWVGHSRGTVIRNKFNHTEKCIGHRQVPVDGFCSTTGEIFQFHGCFWHGHNCCLTHGLDIHPIRQKSMAELREDTKEMTEYLRGEGYNVIEMWECEWQDLKRTKEVAAFLAQRKTPTENRYKMSETEILHAVRKDELFGVVECDIQVPAHLRSHFAEMAPILRTLIFPSATSATT
ncbi:hypothetical protein Bbelb_027760 [Branchiostoma belcheri]|nr:hypothetical protein Bbelb_027760 [Branchiostoma belcheri]